MYTFPMEMQGYYMTDLKTIRCNNQIDQDLAFGLFTDLSSKSTVIQ